MTSYPDHIRDGVDHVIFLASNITSSTALLSWSIPISYQINITSFVIKYKSFSGRSWLYTEHLIFSDSFYQLTCLFNMRWYEVQLLAYPAESVLSTTFFNTTDVIGNIYFFCIKVMIIIECPFRQQPWVYNICMKKICSLRLT